MTLGNFWRLGVATACGALALANACSGSTFSASQNESGGSDAGQAATAGEDSLGGTANGGNDAGGASGVGGKSGQAGSVPDTDRDGFGRASGQVLSCGPPAEAAWARKAGDCNDDNKAVFPKEPDFEDNGYTATSNGTSFDYDCSNQEESDPSQLGAAPACSSLTILNCAGSGFANTARTGPGSIRCAAANLSLLARRAASVA
jgi:hypothetical protein